MNPVDIIWTEKYRPTKVDEVVGDFKDKIGKYLESPEKIPHFLFYGTTPGVGKSSLMKAIVNDIGCDYIIINSSDDRTIDVIREKIKEFAMTQSSKPGLRRAILLDEADGMLKASQEALRNIMETYAKNVFFILTCNNINKIIDPIKSRCVMIPFAYPNKKEIFKYLEKVCFEEEMPYSPEGLQLVVDSNYPSIRNCVLTLQDLHTEGLDVTVENVKPANELFEVLWAQLKKKEWQEIKEKVLSTTIDARELNTFFWMKALKEDPVNIKLLQTCCRTEKDIAWGADPKVVFVTSLVELIK